MSTSSRSGPLAHPWSWGWLPLHQGPHSLSTGRSGSSGEMATLSSKRRKARAGRNVRCPSAPAAFQRAPHRSAGSGEGADAGFSSRPIFSARGWPSLCISFHPESRDFYPVFASSSHSWAHLLGAGDRLGRTVCHWPRSAWGLVGSSCSSFAQGVMAAGGVRNGALGRDLTEVTAFSSTL